MNNISISKVIAKKELEIIGGKPKIFRYYDENETKNIDIMFCPNRPYSDIVSYATIGLMWHDIGMVSENKKLRLELVGACNAAEELFPNIVSTTAFEIIDKGHCEYGDIIPNIIQQYIYDCDMKHIYLMNPFLWDGFKTMEFAEMKVSWLLMVPISDEEMNYAVVNGWDALETKFAELDIDIFNLRRKSII